MLLRFERFVVPFAMALHFLTASAFSQDADIRLQGAIEKIDAQSVAIKAPDGAIAMLKVTPDTSIFVNQPSSLDQIKPGDYVASTTVKTEDGKKVRFAKTTGDAI